MDLIDRKQLISALESAKVNCPDIFLSAVLHSAIQVVEAQPSVDGYTGQQVEGIVRQVDEDERELRKQVASLKSCINCKIRKECPRHCGKVVHDCDHWEHGDPMKDGEWIPVTEKLPEKECRCLIWTTIYFIPDHVDECNHYDGMEIAGYHPEWGFLGQYGHHAKAWMPLPDPPEGGEDHD